MKKILLGFIVLLTIVSCKKNETVDDKSVADFTLSKSGYIQFRDLEAFKSTIEDLKGLDDQKLAEWENNVGLKSLRGKYFVLQETDSKELNPIEEPYFASVVNEAGVFSIGDEIHVITYETEYLITSNKEQDLQNVLDKKIQLSNQIKAFSIQRETFPIKPNAGNLALNNSTTGKIMAKPENSILWTGDREAIEPECGNNGRPERVKLAAFVNNYASYGIIGVKILGEAYRKGGAFGSRAWREDETQYGKIEGVANFTYAGGLFDIPYTVEGYNNADIRKTIYDYYTTPFYSTLNANYIDATYTYQKNGACPLTTRFIRHQ